MSKKNIFQKYFLNIFEQNQIFKKYFSYFLGITTFLSVMMETKVDGNVPNVKIVIFEKYFLKIFFLNIKYFSYL